jgi:heme oxygenase
VLRTLVARSGRIMTTSWMLRRLDYLTHQHHAASDAERIALLRPSATRALYGEYLTKLYGFEQPIESATSTLARSLACARPRARMLRADLLALGRARVPLAPRPQPRTVAEALGWCYVVERGRLLHGVLHRHLSVVLPEEIEIAGSYLASHAGGAGVRWHELGEVLDRVATTPAIVERVVVAAHSAFRRQRLWFHQAALASRAA